MASEIEKIEYLKDIYKLYLSHLSSVFNFFVLFVGLILSGFAFIVGEKINETSCLDEIFIAVGIVFSAIFFVIDRRDRQIINHVEAQILKLECRIFQQEEGAYLKGLPKPEFSIFRNSFLFPAMFLLFGAFLFLLLFLL